MYNRRDFFSSIAKVSAEVLSSKPFYGSIEDQSYMFAPSHKRGAPTLLVVGLRLKEHLYQDHFNIITMPKWPEGNTTTLHFWRKLLIRHDLTDEMYVIAQNIPRGAPSFMKKAVCLIGNGFALPEISSLMPVLLVTAPDSPHVEALPSFANSCAAGSDVFVTYPTGLNIKESPAYLRLLGFFR